MFAVEIWEHWPSGSRQPGQLALLALRSVTRSTTPDTRRRPRRGQVRARAIVTDQTTLSIKVSNDSERHISSISFMYVGGGGTPRPSAPVGAGSRLSASKVPPSLGGLVSVHQQVEPSARVAVEVLQLQRPMAFGPLAERFSVCAESAGR
jgi:hypothetical protein